MCKLNTGFTTFDVQTKSLFIGDFCSDTQISTYVKKESFEEDTKKFDLSLDQTRIAKDFIEKNKIGVLYRFFFKKRGEYETIGFVITDKERNKSCTFGARTKKRQDALNSILNLIVTR